MSVRVCPFCKSPWVCWNWIIGDNQTYIHECWVCSSGFRTPYRIDFGLPYFILKRFYKFFTALHHHREYKKVLPFLHEAYGVLNSAPFDFSKYNSTANTLVIELVSNSLNPKHNTLKNKLFYNNYADAVFALTFYCKVMKLCDYGKHLDDFESRLQNTFPLDDNLQQWWL